LNDAVHHKWQQIREIGKWKIPHDNAHSHSAHFERQFLAKRSIQQVTQPAY
jgi:hypothetical protein